MFSWFKKKPAPPSVPPEAKAPCGPPKAAPVPPPAPPPEREPITRGRMTFKNSQKTWDEEFDLLQIAQRIVSKHGHSAVVVDKTLKLAGTEMVLRPELADLQILEPFALRTVTVVHIQHPQFSTSAIFEFQHSTGKSIDDAISMGFDHWARGDLPALLDALVEKPKACTLFVMDFPANGAQPARKRRAVLGPVASFQERMPAVEPEHPPFCTCCLLTNTFTAFESLMNSDGFYAIRLFASRGADGTPQSDCRINGEDFPAGKEALTQYVKDKWPENGFEFRKQYVILQNVSDVPT